MKFMVAVLTAVNLFMVSSDYCQTDLLGFQLIKEECAVKYTGNEGFLISTKDKKVLIDALFGGINGNWCDQPGDSVSNLMSKGLAPFNKIDLVLVSHCHSDHFNAGMTIDFLRNNRRTILICPFQVDEKLRKTAGYADVAKQVMAIKSSDHPDTTLYVEAMTVRAMRFRHGSWFETDSATGKRIDLHEGIENLGYLLETDDYRILHTGDSSTEQDSTFSRYQLAENKIDAAFFDRVFLRPEGLNILGKYIRTNTFILMHVEPGRRDYYRSMIREMPEFYIFSNLMEEKVITK